MTHYLLTIPRVHQHLKGAVSIRALDTAYVMLALCQRISISGALDEATKLPTYSPVVV
jgi:hypothetical protein